MQLVDHLQVAGQVQCLLDLVADAEDRLPVVAIGRPDSCTNHTQNIISDADPMAHARRRPLTDLIAARPNVHHRTANVVRVLERLADQAQHNVQPELVEQSLVLATQHDQPAAAALVRLVLPHRPDIALEQRVIVTAADVRRDANVIVQAPEVLDGVEGGDAVLHVLPRLLAVVLQIPERPLVVQRMLDQALLRDLRLIGVGGDNVGASLGDLAALLRHGHGRVRRGFRFLCGRKQVEPR